MNILERSALRRAEKTLAPLMEPGERILEFDIGTSPMGRADVMASDRAVYVVFGGGVDINRREYAEIAEIRGESEWIEMRLQTGPVLRVDFPRSTRNLVKVLVDNFEPIARSIRHVIVNWHSGGGAEFNVLDGRIQSFHLLPGTPKTGAIARLVNQSGGELDAVLGNVPGPGYDPTQSAGEWTPPLEQLTA